MLNNIVEIWHSQLFSLFPGWFVFLFFYGALGKINNLSFPWMLSRHSWFSSVGSLTPSSGTSEDLDHQLALQEAKMAARNKIRSRFHSSSDLIHRLFVCISGKSSPSARYSRCLRHSCLYWHSSAAMQVLQISCRPTMQVTCAASSRLCLKSWPPSVSRLRMIKKRMVKPLFGFINVLHVSFFHYLLK